MTALRTVRGLGPDRPQSCPEEGALGSVPDLLGGRSACEWRTVRKCLIRFWTGTVCFY
jgi:hypothetical protein